MAVKRVIIHLGMSKAGSSSIQATLFNNTAALKGGGFKYLTEWHTNHLIIFKHLFSEYPVNPTGTGKLGRYSAGRKHKNKYYIKKLLQVINTIECETLILSGECFHELWLDSTIRNINNFIEKYFKSNGIETTILLIVRNPIDWLTSSLQERLYKNGFLNKNCDFFETIIQQYNGIINLHKQCSCPLILFKFEEACLDKDGLVGCFLKTIGFPEAELKNINFFRSNESRCMEVMELIYFIESIEPIHPYNNYRVYNPYRFRGDYSSMRDIIGVKFELPFEGKIEFWKRAGETVRLLKEITGIDYTPPPRKKQFLQIAYTVKQRFKVLLKPSPNSALRFRSIF